MTIQRSDGFNRNGTAKLGTHRLVIGYANTQAPKHRKVGLVIRVVSCILDPDFSEAECLNYFNRIISDSAWIQEKNERELESLYEACGVEYKSPPMNLIGKTVIADVELKQAKSGLKYLRAYNFRPDTDKQEAPNDNER